MKRLFYPPPFREFIVVIALLLLGNQLVLGEGSKDFWAPTFSTIDHGVLLSSNSVVDTDGDGIDDEEDLDDDNDGIPDAAEIAAAGNNLDTDGDGIPNTLDLDSDNDGISDLVEAGHGQADLNGDGRIDGDDFGANGLHNSLENNDSLGASANYSQSDPDRDGVPDFLDLDSDNDGFSDVDEANLGGFDSDNDGRIDDGMGNLPSIDANGLALVISPTRSMNASIPTPIDSDGDGVPNWRDLDSDNDGLLDVVEANLGGSDGNNDGRIDDGFGNAPVIDANGLTIVISPTRGMNASIPAPIDSDGDGVPNWLDLDSDNDGIHDVAENLNVDSDNDGIIGVGTPIVNGNGIVVTDGGGTSILYNPNVRNTDGEDQPDFLDLDSDGDGIFDVQEAGVLDGDNNGILGSGVPTINVNGIPTFVDGNGNTYTSISNPRDSNGNGTPDFQDVSFPGQGTPGNPGNPGPAPGTVPLDCATNGTPVLAPINGGGTLCANSSTLISVSGVTNGIARPASFTWTGPNGLSESGNVTSVNSVYQISLLGVSSADNGTYTLMVVTEDGCTAQVSTTVNVQNNTPAPLSISGPSIAGVCSTSGQTTPLQLTASNAGANATYEWFLNGVSVGTTSEPTLNVTGAPGNYTVRATTPGGCPTGVSNSYQSPVTAPPRVGIGASGNICGGGDLQLTVTNLGEGATYSWYLADQLIATTTEPRYTIPNASSGDYSVSATLNGCAGDRSAPAMVSNTQGPNVGIGGVGAVCLGNPVTVTASDLGEGATYQWFRDGLAIGTTSEPRLPLGEASDAITGGYTVIASKDGCTSAESAVATLSVGNTMVTPASITIDNPNLCEGESFIISATGVPANATYRWIKDGVLFSTTNRPETLVSSVNIANTGSYVLEVVEAGCTSAPSNPVQVTVTPGVSLSLSADRTNLCSGETFNLTVQSEPGLSYDWLLDGNVVASTSDPSISFNAATTNAGTYTVVPRNSTCSGGSSNPIVVSVADAPTGGSITAAKTDLCPGETLSLSSTDFGAGTTYNWYKDGELISSTGTPTYAVGVGDTTPGTYSMIPTRNGCDGAASNSVNITAGTGVAMPSITGNNNLCTGDALTLNASGGATSYEWFRDGESLGSTNEPTFTLDTPVAGNYTVMVAGDGCGGGTSDALAVAISNRPTTSPVNITNPTVCEGDAISITTADAGEGATYEWFLNGVSVGTTTAPTFEATASDATVGSYSVNTAIGSCAGTPSEGVAVALGAMTATPIISINDAATATICPGEEVILTAVGADATAYEWFRDGESIGSTEVPTLTVGNPAAGNYTVAVSGGCGGGTSDAVSLVLNEIPNGTANIFPIEDLDCGESTREIQAELPTGLTGMWSSSDPNVMIANPSNPSTTASGLGANSTVTWTLSDPTCGVEVNSSSATIGQRTAGSGLVTEIADVLTPNNDGLNDVLRIPDADCKEVGFKIFNRWGDLVYETDRYNNNNGFNGEHDGDPLPPGPYYYVLSQPGSDEKQSGCVSIYR